jgi:Tol biopolymer transport system component
MYVYAWLSDNVVRRLSPPGLFVQACVHPEGKGAVFWGGSEGRPRVWFFDFAAGTANPITRPDVGSVEPSFDWQGRRLVFASDSAASSHLDLLAIAQSWKTRAYGYDTHLNLFVMDADGANVRQITRGPFQDSRPAFSPDGKTVAFLSNRGGGGDGLYLVRVDASAQPRRLLPEHGIGRPWFSSDGRSVYFFFTGVPDEHRRICRVPVEGGPWEPITPDGLPRSHGSLADPDGIHLWFHSTTAGLTSPFRFNLQTRELQRVMPPGFSTAGHVTRSRNGIITFDSRELDPARGSSPPDDQMQRTSARALDVRRRSAVLSGH